MCDAKSLFGFFYPPSLIGWNSHKKANAQAAKDIKAADAEVDKQIEANKIANSAQTTAAMQEEEDLKKKLAAQKVPLNTNTTTGLSVGNSLSTGLNLGGY